MLIDFPHAYNCQLKLKLGEIMPFKSDKLYTYLSTVYICV